MTKKNQDILYILILPINVSYYYFYKYLSIYNKNQTCNNIKNSGLSGII